METRRRSLLKALTWQITGLLMMAALGLAVTGSLDQAGLLSLGSCLIGVVAYVLHERLWQHIAWGRGIAPPDQV